MRYTAMHPCPGPVSQSVRAIHPRGGKHTSPLSGNRVSSRYRYLDLVHMGERLKSPFHLPSQASDCASTLFAIVSSLCFLVCCLVLLEFLGVSHNGTVQCKAIRGVDKSDSEIL